MKTATINELRRELKDTDEQMLRDICLRLIKHKKENKELATYLLFEAHDEAAYRHAVKEELAALFETVPRGANAYYIKKSLRKVLRFLNRQAKYSEDKITELELRIFFCLKVREAKIPRQPGTVLGNIYDQQRKKVNALMAGLEEDLQGDYETDLREVNR